MTQDDKELLDHAKPFIVGVVAVLFHMADRVRGHGGMAIDRALEDAECMVNTWNTAVNKK